MSSSWRRFEVLLPLRFNDGRDVPPDWLAEAVLGVVNHFGPPAMKRRSSKAIGDMRASSIEMISCESSSTHPT